MFFFRNFNRTDRELQKAAENLRLSNINTKESSSSQNTTSKRVRTEEYLEESISPVGGDGKARWESDMAKERRK